MAVEQERLQFYMDANIVQMERALARAEARAVKAANKIDRDFKAANGNVERGVANAARQLDRGTEAMGRFGQITGNQRFVIQNTAAQFGDMAVQIGGGTSAMQAMGQQVPQILGAFGAFGAVLGVAAAVLFPLARYIMESGEASRTFEDALKDASSALNDYSSYAGLASSPTAQLRKEFGGSAEQAREMYAALRDLAELRAMDTIADAAKAVGNELSGVTEELAKIDAIDQSGNSYQFNLALGAAALREEFGLTVDQAREVKAALDEVSRAQGPQQVAEAVSQVNTILMSIRDEAGFIPEPLRAAAEQAGKAAIEGLKLSATMRDSDVAAKSLASVDLASGIAGATTEARLLAATLGIALEKAIAIENKGRAPENTARVSFGLGSVEDPSVGNARLSYGSNPGQSSTRRHVTSYEAPPSSSSRGAGGGRRAEINRDLEEAKRLLESTRTPLQKFTDEVARVNELARLYPEMITPEVQEKAIGDLRTAMESASASMNGATLNAKQVGEVMNRSFTGMLIDAENAGDYFVSFATNILTQVLSNMTAGPAKVLGDAAFSFLSGFLPGATAVAGARAGGGPVRKGQTYLVNENTPNSELFTAPANGAILNVPQAQAALRASTAPIATGAPRVIYVPQPYMASVGAMDDGSIFARMDQVSRSNTARGMVIQNKTMPGKVADDRRRGVNG